MAEKRKKRTKPNRRNDYREVAVNSVTFLFLLVVMTGLFFSFVFEGLDFGAAIERFC